MSGAPPIHILELEELQKDMETIDEILDLTEQGYRIYGALDFSEIFSYAFPLTSAAERWSRDLKKRLTREANLQIALSYLIAGKRDILEDKVIVLPPHFIELRDRLTLLVKGIQKLQQSSTTYQRPRLQKLIESLGGATEVESQLALHEKTGTISEALMANLLEIGENYKDVVPLLGFLSGDTTKGFTAIRELVEQRRISDIHDVWPETVKELRAPLRHSHEWSNKIQDERQDPNRWYASQKDGEALSYLFVLNRVLAPSKQLVVLLTHSHTVLEVAGGITFGEVLNSLDSDLPVVLSPQWATVYLAHFRSRAERTRELLKDSKQKVREINQLEDQIAELHAAPDGLQARKRIGLCESKIKAIQKTLSARIQRAEQLSLASESKHFIKGIHRPHIHHKDKLANLLVSLNKLLMENNVAGQLAAQAEKELQAVPDLWAAMMTTLSLQTVDLSAGNARTITEGFFEHTTVKRIAKTVLRGEIQRLSYTLQFRSKRTRDCARRIVRNLRQANYLGAARSLLGLIQPGKLTSEDHLLVAYFLAVVREYGLAKDELRRGLKLADGPIHELYFLRANLARIDDNYRSGIYACKRAINTKKAWQRDRLEPEDRRPDPRYYNEWGYQECLDATKGGLEGAHLVNAFRSAVTSFKIALPNADRDAALKFRVTNNLAYTLVRIAEATKAEEDIAAMIEGLSLLRDASAEASPVEIQRAARDTAMWGEFTLTRLGKERPERETLARLLQGYDDIVAETSPDSEDHATFLTHRSAVRQAARRARR